MEGGLEIEEVKAEMAALSLDQAQTNELLWQIVVEAGSVCNLVWCVACVIVQLCEPSSCAQWQRIVNRDIMMPTGEVGKDHNRCKHTPQV